MLALLLAAALSGQPASLAPFRIGPQPILGDRTTILRARSCSPLWQAIPVRRTAPAPTLRKLGDLPPANLEIAVLRLDKDGCQIPVIVRYDVEGDGRFSGK